MKTTMITGQVRKISQEPEQAWRLVDAKTISEITGLPVSTVWRASRENKLPYYKYGNRYLYDDREVLAVLKRNGGNGLGVESDNGAES